MDLSIRGRKIESDRPDEKRVCKEREKPKLAQLPRWMTKTDGSDTEMEKPGPSPKSVTHSADETNGVFLTVESSTLGSPRSSSPQEPPRSPYRRAKSLSRSNTVETQHVTREETENFTQLNQYTVREEIGQGAYGVVRIATDKRDSTQYAMKMLSKRKMQRASFARRRPPKAGSAPVSTPLQTLEREIAILKKIDHPNIVKLVEVLDDDTHDELYLVFELVEKGPVMEVGTTETFPEETARHYFIDLVLGIEYLHFQKIIHRDLKPSNLLVTDDGHVKIADFGVSEFFAASDADLTNTAGSPAFMAPESLLQGDGKTPNSFRGKATDVWAMGMTLYCFVYGKVAYESKNLLELYDMIKNKPVPYPEDREVSQDLRDLFERLLEKDPKKRIKIPELKMHPWLTMNGQDPLPSTEVNCTAVEVTDEDVANATRDFSNFPLLVLIKTMGRRKSLRNPFLTVGAGGTRSLSVDSGLNLRVPSGDAISQGRTPSPVKEANQT